MEEISSKLRLTTTLLAVFLGVFGIHRFYLEKKGTGNYEYRDSWEDDLY